MKYKQITAAQRGVIEGLLQTDCTLKKIAAILGVSLSTVSREIKKRKTPSGYFANIAQLDYDTTFAPFPKTTLDGGPKGFLRGEVNRNPSTIRGVLWTPRRCLNLSAKLVL